MEIEKLEQHFNEHWHEAISATTSVGDVLHLEINKERLVEISDWLRIEEATYFDFLSCIIGVDNGLEGTMEVIYQLYSIPYNIKLALKVRLNRQEPKVDSVCSIWKGANWQEREVYDMYGIHFNNHPDLRRILMPNDWEGYPLKKDYKVQEFYHDIPVSWDKRQDNGTTK